MKKPISFLLAAQAILLIAVSALFLSSCIIVHPDDEVIVEKKTQTTVVSSGSGHTAPANPPAVKHSISCRNETSLTITDWCVKKDNTVTFANSSFNRSIPTGHEDRIVNLEEGYYVVYFSFEDDYQLNPWDYQSSESIWLDRDVTYCLYERATGYGAECRSAGASAAPLLYLAGSDGSEIDLICK